MAEPLNIESLKKLPKWAWVVGIIAAFGLAWWYRSSQNKPATTTTPQQATVPGSSDTAPTPNTTTPTGSFCPSYATPQCGAGDIVVFEQDENGCPKPICGSQLISNLGGNSGQTASGTPIVASSAPEYVTVCAWPQWCGSLSGIAYHQGISLSTLLAFPNNAQYRANPNLIYAGQEVQVA